MAKINVINNKSGELTIDPGASGDSKLQFSINGTPEFIIGVDDTDDSFRIANGSALGTTDTLIITDAGERTMPLQPAFLARNSSDDNNVTGDGTVYTVDFNSEEFDQNGDFSADTFTAPVTGRFLLCCNVFLKGLTAGTSLCELNIVTSNRVYTVDYGDSYPFSLTGQHVLSGKSFVDMDASDTATITITASNGSKVVDIFGSGGVYTGFSGCLIC